MKKLIIFAAFLFLMRCNNSPIDPSMSTDPESFLLTEAEMSGYELKIQSSDSWIIGEGDKIHPAMEQTWHIMGKDGSEIYISYCVFYTEAEAIQGTAHAANSHAEFYIWGSLTGSISGDVSWVAIGDGAQYFVRGNVGIVIFKPTN
jgi:hypothetical protein